MKAPPTENKKSAVNTGFIENMNNRTSSKKEKIEYNDSEIPSVKVVTNKVHKTKRSIASSNKKTSSAKKQAASTTINNESYNKYLSQFSAEEITKDEILVAVPRTDEKVQHSILLLTKRMEEDEIQMILRGDCLIGTAKQVKKKNVFHIDFNYTCRELRPIQCTTEEMIKYVRIHASLPDVMVENRIVDPTLSISKNWMYAVEFGEDGGDDNIKNHDPNSGTGSSDVDLIPLLRTKQSRYYERQEPETIDGIVWESNKVLAPPTIIKKIQVID